MTNEITNQSRPWLNKNGSIKSDAQIKAISKEWSLETWEQFLSETVDQEEVYQRELPSFVSDETGTRESFVLPRTYEERPHRFLHK